MSLAAAVCAAALALAGCGSSHGKTASTPTGSSSAGTAKHGGTLTVGWLIDVTKNWDPIYVQGAANADGWNTTLLYDSLVRVDDVTGQVVPRIAQSVTGSGDQLTWTVKLRPGVKFSDGTPVNAQAVKADYDRMADKANAATCGAFSVVKSYSVVDDATVNITLKSANSAFPYLLQGCLGMIPSPTAVAKEGADFGKNPVGAGPYLLSNWVPGNEATFTRNPSYWDAPRPNLDQIKLKIVTDPQAQLNAIQTGQVDMLIFGFVSPSYSKLVADNAYSTVSAPIGGGLGLVLQTTKPPFNDPNARQAVSDVVDLNAANQVLASGHASMVDGSWFTKDSPFYDASVVQAHPGAAAAQKAVDAYVAANGHPLSFSIAVASAALPYAQVFQQQMSTLKNVTVKIDTMTAAQVSQASLSGNYQAFAGGPPNNETPSAVQQLYNAFHFPPNPFYNNPQVNDLLDQLISVPASDQAKQKDLINQVLKITFAAPDAPFVPLTRALKAVTFKKDTFAGIKTYNGIVDFANMWRN